MNNFIDYSQYWLWNKCPAKWYERYVNKLQLPYPAKPRDDAMALGSLVHEGLQMWVETGHVGIPEEIVKEINPTDVTLGAAHQMISGYAQRYGRNDYQVLACEEPIRFPLFGAHSIIDGLAKVDMYFYNPTPYRTIDDGTGQLIYLDEGWWINEYKTKDPSIDFASYRQSWLMNMQASFQMLALRYKMNHNGQPVRGVLVNVIEKPKVYNPKRKCKECNVLYEYELWLPMPDDSGEFGCPVCGNIQKIQKLKADPVVQPPQYYKIKVERSSLRLNRDLKMIQQVALDMNIMRRDGLYSQPWNTEECVIPKFNKTCEYFEHHLHGNDTREDNKFVQVKDYLKEKAEVVNGE